MADEAEAKVKLVADDGGAAQAMYKLAEATKKASAAEDDLQKRLKARASLVRDLVRQDAIRPGGIIDRMPPAGSPGGGIGQGSLAAHHDAARRAARGYSAAGGGAAAGGFGDRAIGAVAGRLGMSRGALMAGGGALAAGAAVHQVLKAHQEQMKVEADPWLTERQKNERKARALPLGVGQMYGAALDFHRDVTGRTKLMGEIQKRFDIRQAQLPHEAHMGQTQLHTGFAEQSAQLQARAMSGLSLARPAGIDRGTVMGERLYNEEARLLPLVQQKQVAAKKVLAAEDIALKAAAEEARIRKEVNGHDAKIEDFRRKRLAEDRAVAPGVGPYGPNDLTLSGFARRQGAILSGALGEFSPGNLAREAGQSYASQEVIEHKRRAEAQARLEAAMGRTAEANKGAAEARSGVRQADAAVQREQAEILSGRETTARGQAERFGMMGVQGRLAGRFALARLQKVGIDRADQETINEAVGYAPETVRKMAGRSGGAGERELGVGRRLTGDSGEFRDTDLADITRRAAEAREKGIGMQEADLKALPAEIARAYNGLAPAIVAAIQKAMDQVRKELEAHRFVVNNQ